MLSSTNRALYKRYLEIISRWPLDPNKESRDLAFHVREIFGKRFPKAELSTIESSQIASLQKEIEALERITQNVSKNSYKYNYSTATGFNVEQLRQVTSNKTVEEFNKIHSSSFNWLKYRLSSIF